MAPTLKTLCREAALAIETGYTLLAAAALTIIDYLRGLTQPPPPEESDEYAHFFESDGDEYDCLLGINGEHEPCPRY